MKDDKDDGAAVGVTAGEMLAEMRAEFGDLATGLPMKHLPGVPTVREVHALLDSAKDEPRDHLILRILYYTGVRVGELEALRLADMSFYDGTAFVRGGKGNKDRYVCVDERTLKLVRDWQGDRPLSDAVIGLKSRQLERVVVHYGRVVGLVEKFEAMDRSFSPHSLRHAYATHRYDAGMDLAVLMKLLGHCFLSTTLVYVETSMRHARRVYRKTDPLRESKK